MKKVFPLIIGVLITAVAFAQGSKQSMEKSLKGEVRKGRFDSLRDMVANLWINYPDSAKIYAREAVTYAKASGDLKMRSISNRLMGGVFVYLSEYDSSKFYMERAIQFAEQARDSVNMAAAINNLGYSYYYVGRYAEALEQFLRSQDIGQKAAREFRSDVIFNNIGLVYLKLNQYDQALSYFQRALQMKNKASQIEALDNIGTCYVLNGEYSKAEKFFLRALDSTRAVSNNRVKAMAVDGLGQTYGGLGQKVKSKKWFEQALVLRKNLHDRKGESETYYHLSKLCTPNSLDSAFYWLRASQRIARSLKTTDRLLENYAQYKILFQLKKNFDSVLVYQTKYDQLKSKQFIENARSSAEGIKLKLSEEESQNQLLLKNIELEQGASQIKLLVIIAALLLISAAVILWFYVAQKKTDQRLTATNQKIDQQNEEIHIKSRALEKNLDDLLRAQQQLIQSEKMASLGLLTAGIAHEINNPINFIGVGITALEKKIGRLRDHVRGGSMSEMKETRNQINQLVQDIKIGASRTEEIVSSLKTFSHHDEAELKVSNINDGIESTLVLLNSRIKNRIEIIRNLDKNLPKLLCYPGQLNQVFMNLLTNAADAIKENGRITITTAQVNNHVEVKIADTGSGIPDAVREKIFEPFFTTKGIGAGTGLGLSISYGIIRQHKGTITISSQEEKGTEFIITLPMNLEETQNKLL